jgi:predicted permease
MNDVKFAFRQLRKSPGFTIVTVLTLAIGIGANTAIFSLIRGAYFRGLPYPQPREIVTIGAGLANTDKADLPLTGPEFVALNEQSRTLRDLTPLMGGSFTLTGEGDAVRFRGLRAGASISSLIGTRPLLGRYFTEAERREGRDRVVVISYELWQRALAGARDVIGREMRLNEIPYTVIGVLSPRMRYGDCDIFVPLSSDLARQDATTRNVYCHARLANGVTLERANAELRTIATRIEQNLSARSDKRAVWLFRANRLIDEVVRDLKTALAVLLGAVGCVLLIACANISNLQLARSVMREKEIAIRLALGANRADIVRQLLIESGLLAFLGGAAGVLLAAWTLEPILHLVPYSYIPIEADVRLDRVVLSVALAVTAATAIGFGLLPAWKSARPALSQTLKESGRTIGAGTRHRHWQHALVISQLAFTFVLLIGATLMMKSFTRLLQVSPGFDSSNVLKLELVLPAARYANADLTQSFYESLRQKLKNIPGVQALGAANILPLAFFPDRSPIAIEDASADQLGGIAMAEQRQIMPGYLGALGISLMQGRAIDERDNASAPPVALVNEAFVAKYFPNGNALGRRIRLEQAQVANPWLTIVGVFRDVRQLNLTDPVLPEVYRSHAQAPDASRRLAFVFKTSVDPASLFNSVGTLVRAQDPAVPIFEFESLNHFMAHAFGGQKFTVFLLGLFGTIALVLSLTGVYGVLQYFVANRRAEIGLRIALGAQRTDILGLVLRQSFTLVAIGITVGLLASLGATRLIASLLYGVRPNDVFTYAGVVFFLSVAALVASYIPARRATLVDPIQALRTE